MGKVIDVRYQDGTSPLKGDKPAYVIIDFDNYLGPPWDKNNPSFVPIPVNVQTCAKRCCTLHHMPLTLSSTYVLGGKICRILQDLVQAPPNGQ